MLWIRTAVTYFGWAITVVLVILLGVALTLAANATAWNLLQKPRRAIPLFGWAIVLAVRAMFGAVPKKPSKAARRRGNGCSRLPGYWESS